MAGTVVLQNEYSVHLVYLAGGYRNPADGRHGRLLSLVAQLGEPRGNQYHPRQFVLFCGTPKGRGGWPQNGGTVGFAASRAGFNACFTLQVSLLAVPCLVQSPRWLLTSHLLVCCSKSSCLHC